LATTGVRAKTGGYAGPEPEPGRGGRVEPHHRRAGTGLVEATSPHRDDRLDQCGDRSRRLDRPAAGVAGDLLAEFAVPVPRVLLPDGQLDPTADRDLDVAVLTGWAERLGRTSPKWR
jgi:hypothetical protein